MKPAERIIKKLDACTDRYERLARLVPDLAHAEPGGTTWSAAERLLQVVLDCAIDVGEMIISWKRLPYAEENRDVFLTLGKAGIIETSLAAKMASAAGLRNVLVHMYDELDYERLRKELPGDVRDYAEYARQIALFVEARS